MTIEADVDGLRRAIAAGERAGAAYRLAAPRTVVSGGGGARIGRRAGGSLEFRDHREYHPGDDLRHVDWNAVARTDRLIVKQFHEEVSPAVDILVDGSRSMALAGTQKAEASVAIAALFATAARNAGVPHSVWIARERLTPIARNERASAWPPPRFDYAGTPAAAIAGGAGTFRPLGVRIVISDLLFEGEPRIVLSALAQQAAAVIVVQILAANEQRPDARGGWRLLDVETGEWREIVFDAAAVSRYLDALARHRAMWDDAARHVRAIVIRGTAEEIAQNVVFDELAAAEILETP